MERIFDTYKPKGFHTVTAYLFVENPLELIDFLKKAFFAEVINRSIIPTNNEISNCILQIDDSYFMISQAREQFLNMRTDVWSKLFLEIHLLAYMTETNRRGQVM